MKPVAILREADADRCAPDRVEARLRAAFRDKHSRSKRMWWFAGAAAALSACGAVAVIRLNTYQPETPFVLARPIPPAPKAPEIQSARVISQPRVPVKRRPVRALPKTETAHTEEFLRIPYAPPL